MVAATDADQVFLLKLLRVCCPSRSPPSSFGAPPESSVFAVPSPAFSAHSFPSLPAQPFSSHSSFAQSRRPAGLLL